MSCFTELHLGGLTIAFCYNSEIKWTLDLKKKKNKKHHPAKIISIVPPATRTAIVFTVSLSQKQKQTQWPMKSDNVISKLQIFRFLLFKKKQYRALVFENEKVFHLTTRKIIRIEYSLRNRKPASHPAPAVSHTHAASPPHCQSHAGHAPSRPPRCQSQALARG